MTKHWTGDKSYTVDLYWADPRCLAHKHGDCVGGPCMCDCHKEVHAGPLAQIEQRPQGGA